MLPGFLYVYRRAAGPNCWVLDAGCSVPGRFWFVPLMGHPTAFPHVHLAYTDSCITTRPPNGAELVGVYHSLGQAACQAYCETHRDALERLGLNVLAD